MIIDILKKIYYGLPGNLRMVIVNIFYLVKLNKIYRRYNSPDYFPVNYIENIDYDSLQDVLVEVGIQEESEEKPEDEEESPAKE